MQIPKTNLKDGTKIIFTKNYLMAKKGKVAIVKNNGCECFICNDEGRAWTYLNESGSGWSFYDQFEVYNENNKKKHKKNSKVKKVKKFSVGGKHY